MSTLTGKTKTAFLLFFSSHIPITLFLDCQVIAPKGIHPKVLVDLAQWYSFTFKDKLMSPPYNDAWFSSFILCELLFQVPFFFVAVYALWTGAIDGSGWFRSACLVYGSHTSTTLVPILATILMDEQTNLSEKGTLFGFYLPYLAFPLWLVYIALVSENVFGEESSKRQLKKD